MPADVIFVNGKTLTGLRSLVLFRYQIRALSPLTDVIITESHENLKRFYPAHAIKKAYGESTK